MKNNLAEERGKIFRSAKKVKMHHRQAAIPRLPCIFDSIPAAMSYSRRVSVVVRVCDEYVMHITHVSESVGYQKAAIDDSRSERELL